MEEIKGTNSESMIVEQSEFEAESRRQSIYEQILYLYFSINSDVDPDLMTTNQIAEAALKACKGDESKLDDDGLPIDRRDFMRMEKNLSKFINEKKGDIPIRVNTGSIAVKMYNLRGQKKPNFNPYLELSRYSFRELMDEDDPIIGEHVRDFADALDRAGYDHKKIGRGVQSVEEQTRLLADAIRIAIPLIEIIGADKYRDVISYVSHPMSEYIDYDSLLNKDPLAVSEAIASEDGSRALLMSIRKWMEGLMLLAANPELVEGILTYNMEILNPKLLAKSFRGEKNEVENSLCDDIDIEKLETIIRDGNFSNCRELIDFLRDKYPHYVDFLNKIISSHKKEKRNGVSSVRMWAKMVSPLEKQELFKIVRLTRTEYIRANCISEIDLNKLEIVLRSLAMIASDSTLANISDSIVLKKGIRPTEELRIKGTKLLGEIFKDGTNAIKLRNAIAELASIIAHYDDCYLKAPARLKTDKNIVTMKRFVALVLHELKISKMLETNFTEKKFKRGELIFSVYPKRDKSSNMCCAKLKIFNSRTAELLCSDCGEYEASEVLKSDDRISDEDIDSVAKLFDAAREETQQSMPVNFKSKEEVFNSLMQLQYLYNMLPTLFPHEFEEMLKDIEVERQLEVTNEGVIDAMNKD